MTQTDENAQKLPADSYFLVVAPVLEVTTDTAAVRGDRMMFNDMPSMLALMRLVDVFVALYRQTYPEQAQQLKRPLDAASAGACLMVLNNSDLDRDQVTDCITALHGAMRILDEQQVLGSEQEHAEKAWAALLEDNHEEAKKILKRATVGIVARIDMWERKRDENASASHA